MEDIKSIITLLTVILGLMKSFLDFCATLRQRSRNGRKRSARHRTPSNKLS